MAEVVDAQDLGLVGNTRGGSNPLSRIPVLQNLLKTYKNPVFVRLFRISP